MEPGARSWVKLNLWPVACLLLPLLLWIGAYQLPAQLTLHLGGDVATLRRFDEDAFFRWINGSEPPDRAACRDDASRLCWWWELLDPGERPYRWTSGNTLVRIPGLGSGPYTLEIAARGQPGDLPTPSDWQIGSLSLRLALPSWQTRRYHILGPSDASGSLAIALRTQPFAAAGDRRELGFVLYELRAAQAGNGPRAPAWPEIGWLSLSLLAAYGVPRILSVGPRLSAASALGMGLAAAFALALARPALSLLAPILAGISLAVTLVASLGWLATRRMGGRASFARQVLALTLLAITLRLGGMFHPQALYSDSAFHAHKLYSLTLGQVFQTAGLPREAGGGEAPYPTGAYLLLLPGQLLLPSNAWVALVQVGTATLDSLLLPMVALLIVRAGLGQRAALLGAACYLLPIPALEALSIGELANVAGQVVGMGFVSLVALGALAAEGRWQAAGDRRQITLLAIAALAAGLLAHSGVTLSLGAFTAAAWLITLLNSVSTPHTPHTPLSLPRLSIVAASALLIALLIYYSAPVYLERILGRVGGAGGGGTDPLTIIHQTLAGIFGLVPPSMRALPPLLGALAAAGLGLLWARRGVQPQAAALRLSLAALWLGTLITQALLLVADQGVRWALFLYPALCLSAGPLLAALYRRGRAGRVVALAALGANLAYGLLIWVIQVRDYFHA